MIKLDVHLGISDELAEIKVCDELSQITAATSLGR